ncbi:adenine phosphoribosyltransferase [Sphingobacterium mizutaii NBRC 14946 = DSM 11724]|uniref:Adenine phosphoribosyltransferase n=2 Tax=Sphingobacterium mizutaii TaxID=1010 RepID=A0AAJ4XCP2_9SPHI|nr:adenine phosphoribosyltransferase [Sphingobacterium mizutaii]GEM67191.1 adenine phosphoribosyltransferase [Sphingobacterium mizutaii NBRC 14946 = DSM 11724]SDK98484.1 adenine phosphoribosyltransferase [Sphingobacterium mizutaii]SNV49436.1 Adenine phosphoribosyltransferase [Sphingobacterium mizutaii]
MIEEQLKAYIRDIPDFPQPGIVFKDITPLLQQPELVKLAVKEFVRKLEGIEIDVIAGIESRGFLFGFLLAQELNKPFVPIRKQGKLPFHTISESYKLEYGQATIEMHEDAIQEGTKVLMHDDLLATGGTVVAASKLVEKLGGIITGYSFVISLDFLQSAGRLTRFSENIISLVHYED